MKAPVDHTDYHDRIAAEIRHKSGLGRKVVFVSGNFNVVHPGHLRLLSFAAACGDFLVVGVLSDTMHTSLIAEELRLEAVASHSMVHYSLILRESPEAFIARLRPEVVVKGSEHAARQNPEQAVVAEYGGSLLFGSGDVLFSSLDLLKSDLLPLQSQRLLHPEDYFERHGFQRRELAAVVQRFPNLKVVVIGDLIVDEYITCDVLGLSQEDPTLVVTPVETDRFLGGAGIVAAHARGLGANVQYFSVVGEDETAAFATGKLSEYEVNATALTDTTRPTTLKRRFRAHNKTLLRVNHLRQHDISEQLVKKLWDRLEPAIAGADLVVFSDFNYGCLPQSLVDQVTTLCQARDVVMAADSQASSQFADVSRFKGVQLVTPTEHEARLAMQDFKSGLVTVAENLRTKMACPNVVVTLGREGVVIHTPFGNRRSVFTDRLPALNPSPLDVSGAGDALLTCIALSMCAGLDIWRASYLGSLAAALQVSRLGNVPLTGSQLLTELA